ncbi:MAG: hypothetical protein GWN99_08285, partial [Gemmatimonadetes bacterium]|nr:hypothetical protein [Gemmatimonadota bacterium]NIS01052.1 hypothetical protein [Gemmatimonadota bacterium]NIT66709.1 hypothetical protein [Gemmatimonadota bacterium]NIU53879.1 hypothetical protein [Gemmatimonadota bacterium]NIV23326.1 hypothetical protein [Gemmatimonadota bacterium]
DRHRRWLERPAGVVHRYEDVERARVEEILAAARQAERRRLDEFEALSLLGAYGVPVV